ncbi:LVIVD repeat-containing protein [Holophaga foetida]|uniref:LVIVD repeat-containing protein n=1 Tax=Holophaga foetida TaxID=35839 RepID=UPI0002474CC3|nr:hypothetical protein [Holophaga foetida]
MQNKKYFSKNIDLIGYHDMGGKPGFQMALHKSNGRYYIYTASFRHPGWNIIDVTDPAAPKTVKWLPIPFDMEGIGAPKLQIADGLMLTAVGGLVPFLHGTRPEAPFVGGVIIWDVKDPENPKQLSFFKTEGFGVHRFFYNGGRYAYVTGTLENFNGFVLRILDIIDPENPVEVGRWWMAEQYLGDRLARKDIAYSDEESLKIPYLHALTVRDDVAYLAYATGGFVCLDVKDKTKPQIIGRLKISPPFSGGASGAPVHSTLPLGGRPYAVVTTEGERVHYFANSDDTIYGHFKQIKSQAMNMIGLVELTDLKNPSLVSVFPYPEVPEGYPHGTNFNIVDGVRVPFGPHNIFDAFGPEVYEKRDDRVYCSHFNAGLRIYDVQDPFVPKEIAYFIPPDPEKFLFNSPEGNLFRGPLVAHAEDVVVDDRGYIYVDTSHDGLYVLRCTV